MEGLQHFDSYGLSHIQFSLGHNTGFCLIFDYDIFKHKKYIY